MSKMQNPNRRLTEQILDREATTLIRVAVNIFQQAEGSHEEMCQCVYRQLREFIVSYYVRKDLQLIGVIPTQADFDNIPEKYRNDQAISYLTAMVCYWAMGTLNVAEFEIDASELGFSFPQ